MTTIFPLRFPLPPPQYHCHGNHSHHGNHTHHGNHAHGHQAHGHHAHHGHYGHHGRDAGAEHFRKALEDSAPLTRYAQSGMGVNLAPLGPFAGAAVTAGLSAVGVPPAISGWAGERVSANAESAGRENDLGAAAVRTFTGVSLRDIQEHGILGGENSEARKVLGCLGL